MADKQRSADELLRVARGRKAAGVADWTGAIQATAR